MRTMIFTLMLLLTAGVAQAQVPTDTAITYQGDLQDVGAPLDGAVDLIFTLWDDPNAGALVGASLQLDNVSVGEGVFTVQLDFGDGVFDGDARWLEIQVRNPHDPGDSAPFVTMSPRQNITPAPYALHALNAESFWDASGSSIVNNNSGFVGINRDYAVGSEWFGVHAPVGAGYGGMYVSTEGDGAKPFYGYYTDTEKGWHYLNGATGDWHLYLDGDRLTVLDENGYVGIGTLTPAQRLDVNGIVRSRSGGFEFPDGTVQATAAVSSGGDGHSLDAADGNPTDVVFVDASGTTEVSGFLGVGRNTTITSAEVFGIHSPVSVGYGGMYASTDGGSSRPFYGYSDGIHTLWHYLDGNTGDWRLYNGGSDRITVKSSGYIGLGTNSPGYPLDVRSGEPTANVANFERSGDNPSGADILQINVDVASAGDSQFIEAEEGADIKFRVWVDGNVTADGAFSGGGADFAEIVKVEAGASSVAAGDVLVIDRNAERGFTKSTDAHSTLVAGVYSTQPGVLASNRDWDQLEKTLSGFSGEGEAPSTPVLELARQIDEIPLAVMGIVPCKVSAENGAIAVGDLLVTSGTPGHAMRAADPKTGTVVGKALESMSGGTGVIEIMVALQ